MRAWIAGVGFVVAGLATPSAAFSQAAPPAPHEDAAFDAMNVLSDHGWHDLDHERWNAYGQTTYISSWSLPFSAPYTNENGSNHSLIPDAERSFTFTATLFLGLRLWPGGEAYFAPEVIAERAFSNLTGIGSAIQNFELQKTGSETPSIYRSRLYLRQRINLGGKKVERTSNPLQLGATMDRRRIVLTVGNFTVLDIFDRNNVTGDPRQTFLNMAFMTHSSWDFAADARGYSWGGAAEIFWDDWSFRMGRMAAPQNPNVLPINLDILDYYADAFELEHDHVLFGQPGAVRLLAYRNHEYTGSFNEAIAAFEADPTHKNAADCTSYNYGSANANAPDLCWVRRPNTKVGIGIAAEQYVAKDVGVFVRAMYSDGRSEVDAYDPADADLSFGAVAKGSLWHRPFDVTGLGLAWGFISSEHAKYLGMGGVDGFVGDGAIRAAPEGVFDVFYSVNLLKAIWLTADYQFLWNPGFNADRGPVHIFAGRVHAEF